MMPYVRPLPHRNPDALTDPLPLAGGWLWFDTVELLARNAAPQRLPACELPADMRARLTAPRAPFAGVTMDRPRIMGILNITPDSFSDGGELFQGGVLDAAALSARAGAMVAQGADILDIGGESTRPGAQAVPVGAEIARIVPAIHAVRAGGITTPISLDTRKCVVAEAGFAAGANMLNDVSGFSFDPTLGQWAAAQAIPTCLMHAQGTPATMQENPTYGDALLDVYDALEAMVSAAEGYGLPRAQIMVDPGIGFGKTDAHILAILRRLSLFHSLGCPILLGVSRKSVIGRLAGVEDAADRDPGSLALGLAAIEQGVQVLRVHDVAGTAQARTLWDAVQGA